MKIVFLFVRFNICLKNRIVEPPPGLIQFLLIISGRYCLAIIFNHVDFIKQKISQVVTIVLFLFFSFFFKHFLL